MPGEVVDRGRAPTVHYRDGVGVLHEVSLDRVVVEEVLAGMPVRDFRWYKGRRFYSGWYWSATTGGMVAYESRLELARILLADFDMGVVGIAAQPFQLSGADGGRVRRHVPDLLLRNRSGLVMVVDVKPSHRLDDADVRASFAWTGRAVARQGWAYEVWSGAEAALLNNVRFLAGYRRRATIDGSLLPLVLAAARDAETIGGLERALTPAAMLAVVRPAVLHLMWSGALRADLSTTLATTSPVWLSEGEP